MRHLVWKGQGPRVGAPFQGPLEGISNMQVLWNCALTSSFLYSFIYFSIFCFTSVQFFFHFFIFYFLFFSWVFCKCCFSYCNQLGDMEAPEQSRKQKKRSLLNPKYMAGWMDWWMDGRWWIDGWMDVRGPTAVQRNSGSVCGTSVPILEPCSCRTMPSE